MISWYLNFVQSSPIQLSSCPIFRVVPLCGCFVVHPFVLFSWLSCCLLSLCPVISLYRCPVISLFTCPVVCYPIGSLSYYPLALVSSCPDQLLCFIGDIFLSVTLEDLKNSDPSCVIDRHQLCHWPSTWIQEMLAHLKNTLYNVGHSKWPVKNFAGSFIVPPPK